jgi:hypothetical protein
VRKIRDAVPLIDETPVERHPSEKSEKNQSKVLVAPEKEEIHL